MRYSALDVAKYIITKCSAAQKPISNLKLQKMLYFLWVDFYRDTRNILFMDDICAWQLGPVVPNVYYEYCSYAGSPINALYMSRIGTKDTRVLDKIIDKYIDISACDLVNITHASGTAWDVIYKGGLGDRNVIPFELILEKELAVKYAYG